MPKRPIEQLKAVVQTYFSNTTLTFTDIAQTDFTIKLTTDIAPENAGMLLWISTGDDGYDHGPNGRDLKGNYPSAEIRDKYSQNSKYKITLESDSYVDQDNILNRYLTTHFPKPSTQLPPPTLELDQFITIRLRTIIHTARTTGIRIDDLKKQVSACIDKEWEDQARINLPLGSTLQWQALDRLVTHLLEQ
jgi:hypothetical protein